MGRCRWARLSPPCPRGFVRLATADPRWSAFLYHDTANNNLYVASNPGSVDWGASFDSFMQEFNGADVATSSSGELGPDNGQIHGNLRSVAGTTHGCVVATDVIGGWGPLAGTYVWDSDGLFVGGIMDHIDHSSPDYMYMCGGEFCHSALYTLPSGDVYFYGNWENCIRIYKVTGWNNWVHQSGQLVIAAPSAADTGQGLTAEYFDNSDFTDLRPRV